MDPVEKREIILEHSTNPLNKESVNNDEYIKVNTSNESCIDNLDIYILIKDNIIKDIKFDGEACAISISSTSIMIKNLINKNIEQAIIYIDNFESMINQKVYNKELLNEANAYKDIAGSRKICALLPYNGIKKILNEQLKK